MIKYVSDWCMRGIKIKIYNSNKYLQIKPPMVYRVGAREGSSFGWGQIVLISICHYFKI